MPKKLDGRAPAAPLRFRRPGPAEPARLVDPHIVEVGDGEDPHVLPLIRPDLTRTTSVRRASASRYPACLRTICTRSSSNASVLSVALGGFTRHPCVGQIAHQNHARSGDHADREDADRDREHHQEGAGLVAPQVAQHLAPAWAKHGPPPARARRRSRRSAGRATRSIATLVASESAIRLLNSRGRAPQLRHSLRQPRERSQCARRRAAARSRRSIGRRSLWRR